MKNALSLMAAASSSGIALAGYASPAAAAPQQTDPVVTEDPSVGGPGDYITTQDMTPEGAPIPGTEKSFDADGRRVEVLADGSLLPITGPNDTGEGGTSTPGGCGRMTLTNTFETLLGHVAFRYITWTERCWNRAEHSVSDIATGVYFDDVDPNFYYREELTNLQYKYAYVQGYDKSGHWHERQSRWENCVIEYGCIGTLYPRNIIRVHHNGTYSWRTDG